MDRTAGVRALVLEAVLVPDAYFSGSEQKCGRAFPYDGNNQISRVYMDQCCSMLHLELAWPQMDPTKRPYTPRWTSTRWAGVTYSQNSGRH